MPDRTNTGVRPGTRLVATGSIDIRKRGEVISGLDIVGNVTIEASSVTIENCRIRPQGGAFAVTVRDLGLTNVVIDHVEIDGASHVPSIAGVYGSGFILNAANIHGTGDGVDVGSDDSVINSWIHDLFVAPGDHTDGVQSSGGIDIRIDHNTIDASGGANSALIFGADLSALDHISAADNVLDGGNYSVYAGTDGSLDSGSIALSDNRFGRGARYGPCSLKPSPGHPIRFSDNVWDDTGSAVTC